ncbi:MAG: sigma-70 family RNA polymerase sigma factor [Acidobacteria bacterium]|nr:sigma-70 family RNA polymerase sigma factor [Acidobacteriota bacterium]
MPAMLQAHDLEALVAAAASGDAEAFAHVIGATSGLVTSIALAIVRDVDMSQDIAQDVFLSAWRDLQKLRNPGSFLPWLRQITRNRAHHVLRGRMRARRWMMQLPDDRQVEAIVDGRAGVAERLLANEEREILREALAALPDETREVLTLYYREGQSVAQVAELLDLSEDAVKKRLSRARATLRGTLLQRLGDTLGATAPGATFAAAVMAALPLAAPVTTSAITVTASKAAGTGGVAAGSFWAWLVWLFTAVAAVFVTAIVGVLGVVLGGRVLSGQAHDDQERRALRRFKYAGVATVIVTAIGFEVRSRVTQSDWPDLLVFAGFTLALATLHFVWLPRILRRRFEAEMRENPIRALAERRRERRGTIIGWTLGLGGAWVGLVLKLWL